MSKPTVKTKATIVGFSQNKKYAHLVLERNKARIQVLLDADIAVSVPSVSL